jgi:putative transposase
MSRVTRNSDFHNVKAQDRTFFAASQAYGHRNLLQSERMAGLLIEVIKRNREQGRLRLHEYVIMPDHFHVLLTLGKAVSIEKAMQYIKGGFSFRAARDGIYRGEVWQVGFTEVQIHTVNEFQARQKYIHMNPVRRGLVATPEEYLFSSIREVLDPAPEHLRG